MDIHYKGVDIHYSHYKCLFHFGHAWSTYLKNPGKVKIMFTYRKVFNGWTVDPELSVLMQCWVTNGGHGAHLCIENGHKYV